MLFFPSIRGVRGSEDLKKKIVSKGNRHTRIHHQERIHSQNMTSNSRSKSSLSNAFSSCSLSPYSDDSISSTPIVAIGDSKGSWKTTSYYLDSSGRSSFIVPLQLSCPSIDKCNRILESGCVQPAPGNHDALNENSDKDHDNENSDGGRIDVNSCRRATSSLKFEVKSKKSRTANASKIVTVEDITILSCTVEGSSILFQTEVVVRAHSPRPLQLKSQTRKDYNPNNKKGNSAFSNSLASLKDEPNQSQTQAPFSTNDLNSTSCDLEITAVLSERNELAVNETVTIAPGLMALEIGAGWSTFEVHSSNSRHQTKLKPANLMLSLTHALSISVNNISGASCGSTLCSLTIQHSNTHAEPVTITNIALHPGHSRLQEGSVSAVGVVGGVSSSGNTPYHKDRSMPGGQFSVTDMSKFVQWGYAPRTEPKLPLTLQRRDAYTTVLIIDAGEDLRSRSFVSPISVTAVVTNHHQKDEHDNINSEENEKTLAKSTSVVVATDAQWTTGRVAVEPADAFRIDMSLNQSSCSCHVGAPLVVSLRVLNLSTVTRDLMLLMAKDADKQEGSHNHNKDNSTYSSSLAPVGASVVTNVPQKQSSVNTAVVSEVNGYTFGVWGLSGDDDGTIRHNRDHELLAVDAALLLGEVKGQHSVDAELRFVPLREGTLDVPNLKLYDKLNGKWYNCIHMLKIVAAAKKE